MSARGTSKMSLLYGPRKVQPQVIEGQDGFPLSNPRFCALYDELLAVANGIKPLAIIDIEVATYVCPPEQTLSSRCPVYDLVKTKACCDAANLQRMPYDGEDVVIVYRPENRKAADLLRDLDHIIPGQDPTFHIVYGTLLGYRYEDIRAWYFTKDLSDHFDKPFISKKQKRSQKAIELKKQTNMEFAILFEQAQQFLHKRLRSPVV